MAEQDKQSEENDHEPEAAEEGGSAQAESAQTGEGASEVEALQTRLEEAEAQAAEARDNALRAAAEAQNARRRAEKDVESARKFALEGFAGDLLAVVDNLERAMQSAQGGDQAMQAVFEGVELTYRSLLDTLARHNIEQVDPEGEPFDPQLHEAMSMVPDPSAEPNSVVQVMQRGYTLNGRLLRPARVVVAQAE